MRRPQVGLSERIARVMPKIKAILGDDEDTLDAATYYINGLASRSPPLKLSIETRKLNMVAKTAARLKLQLDKFPNFTEQAEAVAKIRTDAIERATSLAPPSWIVEQGVSTRSQRGPQFEAERLDNAAELAYDLMTWYCKTRPTTTIDGNYVKLTRLLVEAATGRGPRPNTTQKACIRLLKDEERRSR